MTNQKIGNWEAIALVLTVVVNHIVLNLPKGIIATTSSGTIINLIFVGIIAMIIAYLIGQLLNKFPGLDLLDIAKFLGGKFLKTIIGILFLVYFIFTASILLRSFSEGLKITFFPKTPVSVIMVLFLLGVVITNKLGFQAISRSNFIVMPIVLFSIVFVFIANIDNYTLQRMYPLLGYGAYATFFSGLSNLFAFGGISYLYFLPPYLQEEASIKKVTLFSVGGSAIFLLIAISTLVFLSPFSTTLDQLFPLYYACRFIQFGRFFQRLDAVFLFIWVLAITGYLSIIFSLSTKIFQKMLNLQYNKWFVSLFALITFGVSLFSKDMYEVEFLENTVYRYAVLIIVFGIGLGILVFANIKYLILEKKKGAVLIDKAPI